MIVDSILGAYDTRYFGAGHKRTNYEILETYYDAVGEFHVVASVDHGNESWSEKSGKQQLPHLSTIDGVVLSTLVVEEYLQNVDLSTYFIQAFTIKSGTKAVEDLNRIHIVLKKSVYWSNQFVFKVNVEGMKVELTLGSMEQLYPDLDGQMIDLDYTAHHLKEARHDIVHIRYMTDDTISCHVSREIVKKKEYSGLGSAFSDGISLLEWLVIFSQIGQVLAYHFDCVDRQDSETLWMKSVKAEIIQPVEYDRLISIIGEIHKSTLLKRGGEKWRILNMVGSDIQNYVKFEGTLAHKLPSGGGNYD